MVFSVTFENITVVLLRVQVFRNVMVCCCMSGSGNFEQSVFIVKHQAVKEVAILLGLCDILRYSLKHQEPLTAAQHHVPEHLNLYHAYLLLL